MEVLETKIDTQDREFKTNYDHYQRLASNLQENLDLVMKGGGDKAVEVHKERGKLLARERIELLLDPDSPFLEFSALAAHGMYDGKAPSAGIITVRRCRCFC